MKLNKDNQNLTHYNDQYSYEIEYKYKTNTRYQRDLIKLLEKEMNYIPKSVLDVGCGQGLNTVRFANDWPNAEITGVDLSDIGIEYAKNHYQGYLRVKNLTWLLHLNFLNILKIGRK